MTTSILIIEDETSIAELERDYFELNGFHVDLCHSGTKDCSWLCKAITRSLLSICSFRE